MKSTITIKEIEMDFESAIKILKCIKSGEPEIFERLKKVLSESISNKK